MAPNCTVSSPLSQSQKDIWQLISTGLSVSKIATKLKTTRQYVNQTRLMAQAKLSTTLLEVAEVNDLQVTKLIPPTSHPIRLPPWVKTQSHHHLHHQPRLKSLVLARQPRRSHRHSLPQPNTTVPNRHSPRTRHRS